MNRYVIVGGGVAGATAAQNLRRLDPAAAVSILADEPHPYYYRPRLWEFIAGTSDPAALYYRPAAWYAGQQIDLRLNSPVRRIQPRDHTVTLASGETIPFDRLLLAVGAESFLPDIPGTCLPGVFVLRTLQDAAAIRDRAAHSRRAVVVGGGLLGLETARALCRPGIDVTVVEIVPHLLPRQLDREGAALLQRHLEGLGISVLTGARTSAVAGDTAAAGIRLEDGRAVEGELVLFSAGVVPRIGLARDSGLQTGRGIIVDAHLQSSAPDVFAAGDAAEIDGRVYGLVPPAIEQARAASQNMAGGGTAEYRGTLPSASLKLLGMDLTSLGEATADDPSLTVRRTTDENACAYQKVVLRDGVVIGAILLNDPARVPLFGRLIASRQAVSEVQDRLLDPAFDLNGWMASRATE